MGGQKGAAASAAEWSDNLDLLHIRRCRQQGVLSDLHGTAMGGTDMQGVAYQPQGTLSEATTENEEK